MEPDKTKQNKFLKWALIIGIAILLNLFFNYSISLIQEAPDFDDYYAPTIEEVPSEEAQVTSTVNEKPVFNNEGYELARKEYETDRADYEKMVFLILVSIGIILFIVSLFLKRNDVISSALALGAVIDLVVASVRYWSDADNILRVLILFVALVILIILAYKKFTEK